MRDHPLQLEIPPGLWDHDTARRALADRDIGALFRHFRQHTGASQTLVGSLTGLAQPDVSTIERGRRLVQSADVLTRVASGLQIPPALLGLAVSQSTSADSLRRNGPVPSHSPVKVTGASQAEEDPVRRREMMAGAMGLGATLIPGTTPTAADPVAALERALFEPQPAQPGRLDRLAGALAAARADYEATRYQALAATLPRLIAAAEATRDAATGHRREQAHTMVARAYVLATELGVKQRSEVTWVAADRALNAARASGDPQPIAEAARVLAIAMRRAGRTDTAVSLLARTADSLDTHAGTPPAQALAARACLLMTAAYTAATAQKRTAALDLLKEAEETTSRIPDSARSRGLYVIAASLDECAMYRVSTATALGTPDDGVPHAARVIPARLPTVERRARYLTDTARMWNTIGDPHRAFAALRALERTAPEEVRRPSLRVVTTNLLYAPQHLQGIREFATRTGALTA